MHLFNESVNLVFQPVHSLCERVFQPVDPLGEPVNSVILPVKSGVHLSKPGVHLIKSGVHLSKPGVHLSKPGVHLSKPGVHLSKPPVGLAVEVYEQPQHETGQGNADADDCVKFRGHGVSLSLSKLAAELEELALGLDSWRDDHFGLMQVAHVIGPAHAHADAQCADKVLGAVGHRRGAVQDLA